MQKTATGNMNKKTVKASYEVSLLVAKVGKSHNIAEQIILSATKPIMDTMLGAKVTEDISLILLLNDTIKNGIKDMSCNIKEQLISY